MKAYDGWQIDNLIERYQAVEMIPTNGQSRKLNYQKLRHGLNGSSDRWTIKWPVRHDTNKQKDERSKSRVRKKKGERCITTTRKLDK